MGSSPTTHTAGYYSPASNSILLLALVAQLAEQRTFNPWVAGSKPAGGTMNNTMTIDNIMQRLQIPEGPTTLDRVKSFTKQVVITAKNKVVDFAVGFYQHIESVGVLTLASFGAAALIGELPFWLTLPWWIEAAMVVPVLSVLLIVGLITLGEYRAKKRFANV